MKDPNTRLFLIALGWQFAMYMIVPGFAWWFVLGATFPVWKLIVASLVNLVVFSAWRVSMGKEIERREKNVANDKKSD